MGRRLRSSPLSRPSRPLLALGLEGSANKLGAGVVEHRGDGEVTIKSNVRHTYVTPPGEGFLPSDTAKHHRHHLMSVVRQAVQDADISFEALDCICFTQGALCAGSRFVARLPWLHRSWHGRTATDCRSRRSHTVTAIRQASCRRQSLRRSCVRSCLLVDRSD